MHRDGATATRGLRLIGDNISAGLDASLSNVQDTRAKVEVRPTIPVETPGECTGVSLASSTVVADLPEPGNANVLMYMREQMMRRSSAPGREPTDQTMPENYEDLDL